MVRPRLNGMLDDELMARFPTAPYKVIWAAMQRAYDRGLLEFGTSLRGAWPADDSHKGQS
jgi:hypothetical protein